MSEETIQTPEVKQTDLLWLNLFAFLLILGGVSSLVETLFQMLRGHGGLNFGFLTIFIGRGILYRDNFWLGWAKFITWVVLIFFPILAISWLLSGNLNNLDILDLNVFEIYPAVFAAGIFIVSLNLRKIYKKENIQELFEAKQLEPYLFRAFLIIALMFSIADYSRQEEMEMLTASLGQGQTEVLVFDAETNEQVSASISILNSGEKYKLPIVNYSFETNDNGIFYPVLKWVAIKDFTASVSADGYASKNFSVPVKNGRSVLKVYLNKKPKN